METKDLKVGDEVEIINYGWLCYTSKDTRSAMFERQMCPTLIPDNLIDDKKLPPNSFPDEKYYYDLRPDLIGKKGNVIAFQTNEGKVFPVVDIKEKKGCYDPGQLKITK